MQGHIVKDIFSRTFLTVTVLTITVVRDFDLQNSISRSSPRNKDIIHINKESVPVRYLEIIRHKADQRFIDENHHIRIGKSSFYVLRLRQVKMNSPTDACLCIYHGN